jgi:WD40 repeat protein
MFKHEGQVRSVQFHPTKGYLLSGSLDKFFKQWDYNKHEEFVPGTIECDYQLLQASYSSTGDTICTNGRGNQAQIQLWRNFEGTMQVDSHEVSLQYSAELFIPHLVEYSGKNIKIPLIFRAGKEVAEIQSARFDARATLEFPNRLLYLHKRNLVGMSFTRKDTVTIDLYDIQLKDTLNLQPALTLLGDIDKEEIRILDFVLLNDSLVEFTKEDGSITILEDCIGNHKRFIDFAENPIEIIVSPNPASEEININLSLIEKGFHSIKILNMAGATIKELISGNFKAGSYDFSERLSDLPSGSYLIVLSSPARSITKPLVIKK